MNKGKLTSVKPARPSGGQNAGLTKVAADRTEQLLILSRHIGKFSSLTNKIWNSSEKLMKQNSNLIKLVGEISTLTGSLQDLTDDLFDFSLAFLKTNYQLNGTNGKAFNASQKGFNSLREKLKKVIVDLELTIELLDSEEESEKLRKRMSKEDFSLLEVSTGQLDALSEQLEKIYKIFASLH